MKLLEHPLTFATAGAASVTSYIVAYNSVMTAVLVTCSVILAARKIYKSFWKGEEPKE